MLTVFWDMKGFTTNNFLEKKCNCKQCFLFQLLKQNSPFLLNDSLQSCKTTIEWALSHSHKEASIYTFVTFHLKEQRKIKLIKLAQEVTYILSE